MTNVVLEAGDEKADKKGLRDTSNFAHQLFKLGVQIGDGTCLGDL